MRLLGGSLSVLGYCQVIAIAVLVLLHGYWNVLGD